jgi:hypothetical protein
MRVKCLFNFAFGKQGNNFLFQNQEEKMQKKQRVEQYFEELEKPIATSILGEWHSQYGNCPATITAVETNHRDQSGHLTRNNMVECNILFEGKRVEAQLRLGCFANNKAIILSIEESIPIERAEEMLKKSALGSALEKIGNLSLSLA